MKNLDLRGLSCPEPVLLLKNEMEKYPNESFKILVNEAHTVKNLCNFAATKGKTAISKEIGEEYEVEIS